MGKKDIIIVIPIFIMAIGQIFSKMGADFYVDQNRLYLVFFIIAYLCIISRGFIWIYIFKFHNLSYAYPYTSANYIIVLILSRAIFNEDVTINNILGVILITIGIIFQAQSAKRSEKW